MEPTFALKIPARVHTSDNAKYAEFDAGAWFAQAPSEKIVKLAKSGWGASAVSEEIARFALGSDENIADVFQYAMHVRHGGERCACRCYVDAISALEWLAYRRPNVLRAIRNREHAA